MNLGKKEVILLFNLKTNYSAWNSGLTRTLSHSNWKSELLRDNRLRTWGLMGLLEKQIWQSSKLLAISVDFSG